MLPSPVLVVLAGMSIAVGDRPVAKASDVGWRAGEVLIVVTCLRQKSGLVVPLPIALGSI